METFILRLTYLIPAIIIALSVHEFSHAYVAHLFGDNTARNLGRLTLNPIKHLDPIGTLMLLFVGFGYAKPVPIVPRNFTNYKLGYILTSAAGPISNILMAFLGALVMAIIYALGIDIKGTYLQDFLSIFVTINIGLAVFNLLPIPPLDGSNIILPFLPPRVQFFIQSNQNITMIIMLILIYFGILTPVLVLLRDFIENGIYGLLNIFF